MKRKILLLAIIVLITLTVSAQKEKFEAAFIYQFTRYIDWCPDYKTGEFVIGVLGDSPVYDELVKVAQSKKVGSQNIVIKKYASPAEISEANIVVITSGKSGQLSTVQSRIGSNCTLVITEKSGLFRDGAAISFIEEGGKLLFELNKASFSNHSLSISTQLITLAKTVI